MQTDRILLRPWQESDAEALYKYASDPDVGSRAGWPPHQSVEESLEIIRTVFNNDTTWAIILKETNEPIGTMGYMPDCPLNLPAREGEPLVGYWIGKPYWNQGICTEALQLLIDYVRKETTYNSLISRHFMDNPASGRVMEKCGFVPTGETVIDEEMDFGKDHPMRVLRLELPARTQKMKQFTTPPNHINFLAKNLFGEMGHIINGSIAYLDLNGGGPTTKHSHKHNHLFIVTKGEARVEFENETVIIHTNEAYIVKGSRPHSVWNNSNEETVMIGISVK